MTTGYQLFFKDDVFHEIPIPQIRSKVVSTSELTESIKEIDENFYFVIDRIEDDRSGSGGWVIYFWDERDRKTIPKKRSFDEITKEYNNFLKQEEDEEDE